ncbi:URC4/urg3 family protein [Bradyrhizobium sp. 2TAF24]|uniref:URC4/urg3 family protein n=1 Tax=Bradyrhizobium sp. 2TAF24 TaxID=3233011 RepID=UPI003F8EC48A
MVDALSLLSAQAVRERAHRLLMVGLEDRLPHFRIDLTRLDTAVGLVLATMRRTYPLGEVPFHSRWRHFMIDGEDRWAAIAGAASWPDPVARARAEFDLAIVSVLLDAGAGPLWRYRDSASEVAIGRSEGLALASLDMFDAGAFSAHEDDPLRVDAEALLRLTAEDLRRGFQVTDDNPLVGVEGRVELLRRLGAQLAAQPEVFGSRDGPRPGGLVDYLLSRAEGGAIAAPAILSVVLQQLGPIWPSRLSLDDVPLGDCWRHPSLVTDDATTGLVPLHKLSQWLTYSLIEPLQRAGVAVADIDGLTGLAEYRNGGLFIDTGVLSFRDPAEAEREYDVGAPLIVEWRALTVALLDQLAQITRQRLGVDAAAFPLAKILEGGTWAAGRAIAFERRPDGSPPIKVVSDGTVF